MFSVVIPTMWKYAPFLDFLKDLLNFPLVGEVILINNDIDANPDKTFDHSKLLRIDPPWNIGVNPAWNIGVEVATYDYVCVSNDDILFDFKLFNKIVPFFKEDTGALFLSGGEEKFNQVPVTNGNIDIVPWEQGTSQSDSRFGFGSLFFIEKKKWIAIPDDMKIYFGDDWLIDTQIHMQRKNYTINNCFNYTPRAVTCKDLPNVSELLGHEHTIYEREIETFKTKYTN